MVETLWGRVPGPTRPKGSRDVCGRVRVSAPEIRLVQVILWRILSLRWESLGGRPRALSPAVSTAQYTCMYSTGTAYRVVTACRVLRTVTTGYMRSSTIAAGRRVARLPQMRLFTMCGARCSAHGAGAPSVLIRHAIAGGVQQPPLIPSYT